MESRMVICDQCGKHNRIIFDMDSDSYWLYMFSMMAMNDCKLPAKECAAVSVEYAVELLAEIKRVEAANGK